MQRPNRSRGGELRPDLLALHDQYVVVAGEVATAVVEREGDERKIDHLWIDVRAGTFGRMRIALSTCSRPSRAAGFDERVRVGIIHSTWEALPAAGVRREPPLDYGMLEAVHPVEYTAYERHDLEEFLLLRARRCIFAEAWGEFYVRSDVGVHQIHSRRASSAMPRDVVGRDGAIQFYFRQPNVCEMLLFKFTGQP